MKRNILLMMAAFISIFSVVTVVYAQGKIPSDDEVNAIAKKLYCPVCPNTPLDVCETKACEDWRAQIRDQLSAGWNEQQIIDYFVAQYGERVLAEPQRKGFSSLVWVLPVLGVVLGVVLVWQVLKNWRSVRQSPIRKVSTVQVSPETIERIENELREMK
jgi:cytochrome c-type biogenesis protein CcmH